MAHLHGYEILGDPPAPVSSPGRGERGTITLEPATEEWIHRPGSEVVFERSDAHGTAFTIARRGSSFVIWARGRGSYEADPTDLRVRVSPGPDPPAWGHHLATVVIPLLLAERGEATLHASGIVSGGRAILFCGPSGRGKSTTTMLATGCGFIPLTDDAAVIARADDASPYGVCAGGAGLWATPRVAAAATAEPRPDAPDQRASRRLHRPTESQERLPGPSEVGAVVALQERREDPLVRPLAPADALPKLVPALLHVGDRRALEASFVALAAVLEAVPAWEVAMPADLEATRDALPGIVETLLAGP
ncbi:MAG TPA: hypothetical protein VKA36_05640 [Solirubrobacterales bacterium]|nr:hypothetical protein [Solirubrobacterales bacterium]